MTNTVTPSAPVKKSALEIKVIALNLLNEHAARIVEYEKSHFSQFIGKDILKVDGSFKQKFEHERLEIKGQLPDGTHYQTSYYFDTKYQSLSVRIKICVNGGSYEVKPSTAFCEYNELTTEIFIFENGKLTPSPRQTHDFSVRYNIEKLLNLKQEAKKLAEAYQKAVDSIPYQFRQVLDIERLTRS